MNIDIKVNDVKLSVDNGDTNQIDSDLKLLKATCAEFITLYELSVPTLKES